MAFKISDLEKFIKEGIDDEFEDAPSDIGAEFEQFADAPEDEDPEVPIQASEVDDAFELDPSKDGYDVSKNGRFVCCVSIMCNGEVVDISEVIDPSKCTAIITDVAVSGMAEEYKAKLESMGYSVTMEG